MTARGDVEDVSAGTFIGSQAACGSRSLEDDSALVKEEETGVSQVYMR